MGVPANVSECFKSYDAPNLSWFDASCDAWLYLELPRASMYRFIDLNKKHDLNVLHIPRAGLHTQVWQGRSKSKTGAGSCSMKHMIYQVTFSLRRTVTRYGLPVIPVLDLYVFPCY